MRDIAVACVMLLLLLHVLYTVIVCVMVFVMWHALDDYFSLYKYHSMNPSAAPKPKLPFVQAVANYGYVNCVACFGCCVLFSLQWMMTAPPGWQHPTS